VRNYRFQCYFAKGQLDMYTKPAYGSRIGKVSDASGMLPLGTVDIEMDDVELSTLRAGMLDRIELQPLACGADEALIFNNQVQFHDADDPNAHRIIVHAEDFARDTIRIEKVMARLVAAKSPLFRWPFKARNLIGSSESRAGRGPARLAADLLSILRPNLAEIRSAFPKEKHQLHPLVELFERQMERNGFWCGYRPTVELDVSRLNACVEAMRQEARSTAFRRHLDKHLKLVRNNTRSALELVDALFAMYSQLVVVRIDLCYERHPCKDWLALPVMDGNAFGDRTRLIRYLTRKCPCRPVAYVWKTEWAEHTGWHTHMLLFFDGNQHQQDITIARMIGKHWNEEITRGKGRHHISNFDQHQSRGVGKVRYDDAAKLWALCTIVVPYLTKADYYIRLLVPPKTHTFGRSGKPKIPAKKLGRPRINSAARMLGYTGAWSRPGYSKRIPGNQLPKLKKSKKLAYSKHDSTAKLPYRSMSKKEYQAKVQEAKQAELARCFD
jgi:hypothetical protein